MKKSVLLVATAIAALGSSAVMAQQNILDTRQAVIERAQKKGADQLEIGFYPYEVEKKEAFYWANSYIPLANYLSEETGYLVSLVPERRIDTFKNLIKAQRYKFIYVTPILAVIAQEIGYTPLAKYDEDVESVFVVKADSKISKPEELSDKNLAWKYKGVVGDIANAYIKQNNIKANIITSEGTKLQLLKKLEIGTIDSLVLRKTEIEGVMKEKEGKFKVIGSAGKVPGFILMAHISATDAEVDKVKSAYFNINTDMKDVVKGFGLEEGIKGFENKSGKIFADFNKDYLKETRKIQSLIEPDYGRYVYDPVKDTYKESYNLYVKTDAKPAETKPAETKK